MTKPFRHALPLLLPLVFGIRPSSAAELDRPVPAGMEWWRLRTGDVLTTGSTAPVATRKPPTTEIPETRRSVRVVYPGLSAPR